MVVPNLNLRVAWPVWLVMTHSLLVGAALASIGLGLAFGVLGVDLNLESQWRPFESLTAVFGGGLIYDREKLPSILHVAKEDLGPVRAGHREAGVAGLGRLCGGEMALLGGGGLAATAGVVLLLYSRRAPSSRMADSANRRRSIACSRVRPSGS